MQLLQQSCAEHVRMLHKLWPPGRSTCHALDKGKTAACMSFCAKPERRACLPDAPRMGYGDSRLLADDALRTGGAGSRPAMMLPAEGRLRAGAKPSACAPPCMAQLLPPAEGEALLAGARLDLGLGF